MLLAIDMGNTQTAMGLFDGDELVQSWRMPTDRSYTADEIHVRLMGFFKMYGLSLDAVDAIAFAGVVPQLSREWHAVADRIAADAIVIGPQTAAVTKLRAARPPGRWCRPRRQRRRSRNFLRRAGNRGGLWHRDQYRRHR